MKVLLLRFSSIGDIVLTSPVIRCIKLQIPNVELHFATKKSFAGIIEHNPYVDKAHYLTENLSQLTKSLKKEKFDYIIDLHKNIRTLKIKSALKGKAFSFDKLNWKKWLAVNTPINTLTDIHIVDRYFEAVKALNVSNDQKGIDFFIPADEEIDVVNEFGTSRYISVAIGAKFGTKQIPTETLVTLLKPLNEVIVLLGGPEDKDKGEAIRNAMQGHTLYNTCGLYSLATSASVVAQSSVLVSGDTGLMHIATAFSTPIVSIWGNTIPGFGMFPYRPQSPDSYTLHEVANLNCRPCSKIGFEKCPKKHFDCMKKQNIGEIRNRVMAYIQ
jgi:ADP-heptose:LPS heptosyltransferase